MIGVYMGQHVDATIIFQSERVYTGHILLHLQVQSSSGVIIDINPDSIKYLVTNFLKNLEPHA